MPGTSNTSISGDSHVGVETDLNHSRVCIVEQVVDVVLPIGRLQVATVELVHAGVSPVQRKQVNVGRQSTSSNPETLIDGSKLVEEPPGGR